MLVLLLALAANAADFKATLDKKPYVVKTALGTPNRSYPWVWGVLVSDEAYTCEQVRSGETNRTVTKRTTHEGGKTKTTTDVTGPANDTRLAMTFRGAAPGTTTAFLVASGKGGAEIALDRRTVTIEDGGTLAFDLNGERFAATGSLPFTMCGPLGERPVIAWTGAAVDFTLSHLLVFRRREGTPPH